MNEKVLNRINILIKKTYCTALRYKVDTTFVYIYHEEELSVTELTKHVRITDQFVQIDKNHYFINFAFTPEDDAFKASQNLLHKLDKHFNNTTSCIALDKFDTSKSPKIVLNRLTQILNETRKNSYSRIEDESILRGFL